MTDLQSLIRLQTWLSPAFPTGAFSYSHGLEAAIINGMIVDQEELVRWLRDLLRSGPGWNDAVLLAEAWRQSDNQQSLIETADLASALSISSERHLETVAQGSAFLKAAKAWGDVSELPNDCALPVAVGACAARLSIELEATIATYLHAYLSNQVQAALRLMKLGQQGGVEILAAMEEDIIAVANRAGLSTLDDLGSNAFMADIAAMQHETLISRIFKS